MQSTHIPPPEEGPSGGQSQTQATAKAATGKVAFPGNHSVKQALLCGVILGAIAAIGTALLHSPQEAAGETLSVHSDTVQVSPTGAQTLKIETASAWQQIISADLQITGTLSYPANQCVKISPRVPGRVRQVFVNVGDRVHAGQTLAVLESADAAAALAALRQSENKLRLAKSVLDRQERLYKMGTPEVTAAQAALDQARAQTLAKKDVLARLKEQAQIGGFTQKPVEDARNAVVTARSSLALAQSDLAQAERDNARKVKLVSIGIAAKSEQETSANVLEKAQIAVGAGKETLTLAQQQLEREQKAFKTNLYADQAIHSGQSDYEQALLQQAAAEKTLRLAQTQTRRDVEQARSDYQGAQTDATNARLSLRLMGSPSADGSVRVTAPAAGLVLERDVNPGQAVDQSQETPWQMFVLGNADRVWVDADVYEKDIAGVAPGQKARIRVAALPGHAFMGVVTHVSPIVDPKTRTVKVRAEIPNANGLLKDGMFADVTVLRTSGHPVVLVPLSAVQRDGDRDYVYVARDGKYIRRAVQMGESQGENGVVRSGVQAGERVVTHGAMFLGDQSNSG